MPKFAQSRPIESDELRISYQIFLCVTVTVYFETEFPLDQNSSYRTGLLIGFPLFLLEKNVKYFFVLLVLQLLIKI